MIDFQKDKNLERDEEPGSSFILIESKKFLSQNFITKKVGQVSLERK